MGTHTVYRVCFISSIAFLFHPKGVNMPWLGFRHYTSKQTLSFGFHAKPILPQQQRRELLFCSDLRHH